MMTLAQASAYFDRTPVLNPDNDAVLFYGQLDPYDDSKRDAGAAYRRVLNVAPGTNVPSVIRMFAITWLVGTKEVDGLEVAHRDKYVLQQAGQKAKISRLADYLAGVTTSSAWSAIEWLKDTKELEVSSDVATMYTLIMPPSADLREHDIVWYAGRAFIAQAPRRHPSGYMEATALELEQAAPTSATILTRTYDPVAGDFVDDSAVTAPCQAVRWQSLYAYGSQADERFKSGDVTLVLPPDTGVSTASIVTVAGADWQVLSVETLAGALVLHGRPA
jgi:hypothetical protein